MESLFPDNIDFVPDDFDPKKSEAKTVQRIRFEAEVQAIRRRYGGLDQMRESLGLSRRKICERLMVDPSAWTRWTANGEESAPPHVYKTLALLLEKASEELPKPPISEGILGLEELKHLENDLKQSSREEIERISADIRSELKSALFAELRTQKVIEEKSAVLGFGWKLLLLASLFLALYAVIFG